VLFSFSFLEFIVIFYAKFHKNERRFAFLPLKPVLFMEIFCIALAALSTLVWVGFVLLPWRPWSNQQALDAPNETDLDVLLQDITVIIPARDEAEVITQTLQGVINQGSELEIILIDDGSEDGTTEKAVQAAPANLRIVRGQTLPAAWGGKLWALEQGRRLVRTPYTLLLDADIALDKGIVKALREKMQKECVPFISLMAAPSMSSGWEKFLMPAFVYFFKVLYPFERVNSRRSKIAAAAGGCILIESKLLEQIGGFTPIKLAVIDDCSLARRVKSRGVGIWLGVSHSVKSIRRYQHVQEIWNMVARSAFAQLRYSVWRLVLCTLSMLLIYEAPVVLLASQNIPIRLLSIVSLTIMVSTYLPTPQFYHRSWAWGFGLPLVAALFLLMTWTSALRYWRGEYTRWKGRIYRR